MLYVITRAEYIADPFFVSGVCLGFYFILRIYCLCRDAFGKIQDPN